MSDPANLTLVDAADAIQAGRLSPLELTEACLRRIAEWEPFIKSFILVDADQALSQARALTEERAHARVRGPLHGIPIGVKDVIDVANLRTTAASKLLATNVAAADAPLVSRLRSAGAVILGKTNTHEFALGVGTPPTRNPWDVSRIPGGSSGGSAAAVASGECIGALGTDTGGSIRIPAALCGVSGLKPRPKTVPMEGILRGVERLDSCGPIARTAQDLALLWEAMSQSLSRTGQGPDGLRLGTPAAFSSVVDLDSDVEAAVDGAVATLCRADWKRIIVDLPRFEKWDAPHAAPALTETLQNHERAGWFPQHADDYTEEVASILRRAQSFSASDVASSLREIGRLKRNILACFDSIDVLALPTTPIAAPYYDEAIRESRTERDAAKGFSSNFRTLSRLTLPLNWCGLASVSVPCGFTRAGVPIGLQLAARDEAIALDAAIAYQRLTDFHERRPRVPGTAAKISQDSSR